MNIKRRFKILFEEYVLGTYLKKYNYDVKKDFKPNDVFLVGYPKSGNTWLQNLVAGILFGIDTKYLPDHLTQELVPPVMNRRIFKRFLQFNCFKSHELPHPEYRRVILLVRDGRDVMPSYLSMNKKLGKSYSMEQMVKKEQGLYPSSWAKYYRQWISNPHSSELMILKYEDLVQDTFGSLERICQFLGIEREPELLQKVIEGNMISKMREKSKTFGTDHRTWKKDKQFYRKGKVGSYKEDFDPTLLKYFETESKDILSYFEYI